MRMVVKVGAAIVSRKYRNVIVPTPIITVSNASVFICRNGIRDSARITPDNRNIDPAIGMRLQSMAADYPGGEFKRRIVCH